MALAISPPIDMPMRLNPLVRSNSSDNFIISKQACLINDFIGVKTDSILGEY